MGVAGEDPPVASLSRGLSPHCGRRVGRPPGAPAGPAGRARLGRQPDFKGDRARSQGLPAFLPLLDVPGVSFLSLQKGRATPSSPPARRRRAPRRFSGGPRGLRRHRRGDERARPRDQLLHRPGPSRGRARLPDLDDPALRLRLGAGGPAATDALVPEHAPVRRSGGRLERRGRTRARGPGGLLAARALASPIAPVPAASRPRPEWADPPRLEIGFDGEAQAGIETGGEGAEAVAALTPTMSAGTGRGKSCSSRGPARARPRPSATGDRTREYRPGRPQGRRSRDREPAVEGRPELAPAMNSTSPHR